MNKWIGLTLGAAVLYGLGKLLKMQNVSDQATVRLLNPRVQTINLSGITFRTEVAINNPSKDSITITKPVVSVTSNGQMLAQSNAENKEILIKPLGVSQIDTIELQVSWNTISGLVTNVLYKVPALIKGFKAGNTKNLIAQLGVPMFMSFTTYVNGIFYQSAPTKLI